MLIFKINILNFVNQIYIYMNYTISIWLKNIRKMRGLTLDEVSQRLNGMVTKQAISKYERGLMKPSSFVLIALCNFY